MVFVLQSASEIEIVFINTSCPTFKPLRNPGKNDTFQQENYLGPAYTKDPFLGLFCRVN